MPYEDPVDAEEFKAIGKGISLDNYRRFLVLQYTKPPSNSEAQQLDPGRWKISEVRIFKDQHSLFKHEYLVATLRDVHGMCIYLRIERRIQQASVSQNGIAEDGQGKISKLAADDISICSDANLQNSEQLPVDRIVFTDGNEVTLPRLVVLACMISKYCASYHIAWRNCYWFCYVASEVLKRRFPSEQLPVEGSGELGCWHGISVCLPEVDKTIDDLLKNYDETWTEFIQGVDKRINHPNNRHTLEARQAAEVQKRRADEEERRADQEASRRGDLEHEVACLRLEIEAYKAFFPQAGI